MPAEPLLARSYLSARPSPCMIRLSRIHARGLTSCLVSWIPSRGKRTPTDAWKSIFSVQPLSDGHSRSPISGAGRSARPCFNQARCLLEPIELKTCIMIAWQNGIWISGRVSCRLNSRSMPR